MNGGVQMALAQGDGTAVVVGGAMDDASRAELLRALDRLRKGGGLVLRAADMLGGLVGRTLRLGTRTLGLLPGGRTAVQGVVETALRRAFDIAVLRLEDGGEQARSKRLAGPLVVASGAVGGLLGLGGFVPDAAVTTLAIMREIARIAQEEGESLDDADTRAACLQVFALQTGDDVAEAEPEMGYFSARMVLQGRPLAMLLAEVASRFGLTLSQKLALQAVPVVGAIGGAAVNGAFLAHYRDVARAHFTVRRMERVFGADAVRAAAAG